jgi:hypothetical protein
MIVWLVVVFVLLIVAWLSAGKPLALLLDRLIPFPTAYLPVSPLSYDGGGFVVGDQSMTFGMTNNDRAGLELTTDSSNQVVLSYGRDAFVLGPRTNPVDASGRPEIDFVAGRGDQLRFAVHESLIGWPTPFDFRFPWGPSSLWKKYVYYRLTWIKPSGARLEMRWRYQRDYYGGRGWSEPVMRWNSQTGLASVDILSESKRP